MKIVKLCKVPKCSSKHHGKGFCSNHYMQMRRRGTILERTRHTPNEFVLKEDHAEIVLYNKKSEIVDKALIDLDDVKKCQKHKWGQGAKYVVTVINKKPTTLRLIH